MTELESRALVIAELTCIALAVFSCDLLRPRACFTKLTQLEKHIATRHNGIHDTASSKIRTFVGILRSFTVREQ